MALLPQTAARSAYDVVIVGGAMMGSSAAFWLSRMDPGLRVLVAERDPSYQFAATTATNSCIRQQFGSPVNVKISQFSAEFIRNFREHMADAAAPAILLHSFGYLYLADTPAFAQVLRDNTVMQNRLGAATRILTPGQIAAEWPFYALDGIILGSHNPVDEGYFDGGTMFDWFRRKARTQGAEYVQAEVTAIAHDGARVTQVTLANGQSIDCGHVVNASGTRANATAALAGLSVPIEPRRRFTWIFDTPEPLARDLPLTIDPSGVHVRTDGRYYMAGCPPEDGDPAVAPDDFHMDHTLWEDKVWPAIAARVPAFERARVMNAWVGHYDYNTLDQNAIIGPHPELNTFLFCNGFSGHGLQQSPAMGRGIAEIVIHGGYRGLDLSPLGYERIIRNEPLRERAII